MDVLAGQTFSAPLPVTVRAVRAELPAIEPAGPGGGQPLSLAQQRLRAPEQAERRGPGHAVAWRCRLRGDLDARVLRRALERVVARHDALRTTVRTTDGEPEQHVAPVEACGFALAGDDLGGLAEADARAELERVAAAEADAPFAPERGPLVRGRLVRLGAREHVLLLTLHPLAADAASLPVLANELGVLYAAFLRGEDDPLPPLPVQYADYAAWQRRLVDGDLLRPQADYWREVLAGAPDPLELPADRPRPAEPDPAAAAVRLELDEETTSALRALGGRHGASLSTTLLAGWAAVLARLSGQTDLVVGASTGTRGPREVDGLIGCFDAPLPVRVDLSDAPTAATLLGRVEARVQDALRNGDLPLQHVEALVQPEGAASDAPLYRAAFAWRGAAPIAPALPGVEAHAAVAGDPHAAAGADLALALREDGGGVTGEVLFATALFDRATVERYAGYLRRVLAGMAADETRRVDRLTLLSDEERRRVVHEWNRTEAAYPADGYIHERFQAQAARTPEAVAVVFEDRTLTYDVLNRRANRLAHRLRALGVGPDVRVGICVEREPELLVAVLGVLKSGGAYLPLDPGYPQDRLHDMVRDSAPVALVTHGAAGAGLAGLDLPVVALDEDAAWWAGQPDTDPVRAALTPENLTYVIYTSGSTGRPKGVEMTHRGASNLLHWYLGATGITDRDAVLVVTSFSFHLTQRNLLAPLFVGGRVHLAREPFEPARITAQILASGITMMNLTPTGFQALVEADGGRAIGGLRIVVFGGEALYPRQLARVPEPRPRFLNPYGATEATGITAHHFASGEPGSYPGRSVPPGRPIANASIYVLDGAGQPVPVGVTGELYLGGAGVTRGYRRLPGQTAERFLPDPFGAVPGARLYRTGDLGRWRPDGTIEFLGRADAQVKVRGFRVELGEIEARLAEHAAVREVVVVARDGQAGDPRLVAYLVGDRVGTESLRAHLAERLPEYMIPAAFVHMDALPVNPNGKLDRKALPAPEYASEDETYVAPRTPVEEVLAGIWAEVLGVERVGVHDQFFGLGGHSLMATSAVSWAREVFGVELPLRALFEAPTVAQMASRVEEMRREGVPVLPPVVPVARAEPPASFAQERLWFLDRFERGTSYNLPFALRLRGALDVDVLERSLREIVRRHDALRTTFRERDGTPLQVVSPFQGFALPMMDLSHLPEPAREAEVQRELLAEGGARPFDLSAGPLFRAGLLRLGAEEHVLLLSQHHIVSDGWSMGVLYREMAALYEAYRAGAESPLPELEVQYTDYAVWQREEVGGRVLERQLAYWRDRLAGAPELLELPTDRPRPAVRTYRGARVPVEIPQALVERLQALGRSEGATLYMTLLAAFQVLLGKYSGSDDIIVGSPIAGRTRKEIEGLIGFFVNSMVLRTDLSGDPSFREVLRRAREVTLGAYEHQEVPFEKLVAELRPERSLSHAPLFQVMLTLQNAGGAGAALPGLHVSEVEADRGSAKLDLALVFTSGPNGLRGGLTYSTDLFERGTVERMLRTLERLLEQVADDADVRLSRLALLGGEERAVALEAWNRTEAPYEAAACLHELFERQAERAPEAEAVVFADEAWSYAELNARANRLAHHLRARGVGPDVRVGICVERGPAMVAAVLAVLKAGGAYVPLDPAYPRERLAHMLADSAPAVVLTERAVAEALEGVLGAGVPVLELDAAAPAWASRPESNPPRAGLFPEHPAYVIYTSGSTGRPKGVLVPHRGLCNVAAAQQRTFGVGPDDRVLQFASLSFDAAAFEIVMALASGAALVVAPRAELFPGPGLVDLMRRQAITTVTLPPSALAALPVEELPALRTITTAGEALPAELVGRWGVRHRLWNLYGPTEATIWSTASECADPARTPDIGHPVANTRTYVLDAGGEPLPAGVPGELYVGGAGVARGYLGRPALTAERFVPDPFGGEPGARLYRSGDRVRWLADGRIDFIGRVDHQVKVRGYRIELGEIEARLEEHPAVRQAVVLAREDAPGEKRLVAYVVGGEAAAADVLRAFLAEALPEYMVPAAYLRLDELPRTPNGKLDRRALPSPEDDAFARRAWEAPVGETEELLAQLWSEVLGVERVSRWDDFFELGGHSLLAVQVIALLEMEIDLGALFAHPVLHDFAREVEASGRAELPPIEPAARQDRVQLSFAQQRLWFLEQLGDLGSTYHMPTRLRLRGALDRAALGRALDAVVARHESLRTTFPRVDGAPEQRIAPPEASRFALRQHDLRGRTDADAELARLADEEARAPFDLAQGPLIRGRLVRLADADHVLLVTTHHIVSDGWSMGVLNRELGALYGAFRRGEPDPLPPLAVQYADYAAWQRRWVEGGVLREQADYWARTLGGAPELLALPTDRPRPAEQDHAGARVEVVLDEALTDGLRALARRNGTTLFMTVLAGWAAVLGRLSGQDDVVVGTPTANRGRREIEGLVGFFLGTLPLRVDLSGAPTVPELLGRVRRRALEAQCHQDIPFEQVVERVDPARSMAYSPLFQVMLTWQNAQREPLELPGVQVAREPAAHAERSKFDLALALGEREGRITGGLTYATALFDRETVARWTGYLRRVLEEMVADESRPVERLALMPGDERARVVDAWNRTDADYPADACLHERFEAQAARTPASAAVVSDSGSLTYAELNARANRLAHHLRALGVGPDVRVGLCVERGPAMVVGVLGVLKAGGVFVPLDPAYPAERLAYMLDDSAPAAVLAQGDVTDRFRSTGVPVLELDAPAPAWADRPDTNPGRGGLTPAHPAYVTYTSGSTGRPKGVPAVHRKVMNLVHWYGRELGITERDAVLLVMSFSFDGTYRNLFAPLFAGGALHLAADPFDPAGIVAQIAAHGIGTVNLTPTAFQSLVEADRQGVLGRMRTVVLVGEPVPARTLAALPEPRPALVNLYGPTECSGIVTWHRLDADPARYRDRPVPAGRPIPNGRVYVLDRGGSPVPVGVAGELYIGGTPVGNGYQNNPALTAERFVADPFGGEPGARLYRTGDRARWLPDGTVEVLGRMDFQVKVRGYRIEPGEVEARLAEHPDVRDAVVLVREDAPGEPRLVAYWTGGAMEAEALRAHLDGALPAYMVPSAYVRLERLPLTPNGKLDRRALPAPEGHAVPARAFEAPVGATEQALADIWAEVLRVERVGREDGFFELGGHSLLAVQVVSRVREVLEVEIPLRIVFEQPRLSQLARHVMAAQLAQFDPDEIAHLAGLVRASAGDVPVA